MNPRQPWFVAGFLAGSIGAAATVLLTTPLSGRELRALIRERLETAKEEARIAGREAEAEVLTRYRHIRGETHNARLGFAPSQPAT
jgi:gas vesicle protein